MSKKKIKKQRITFNSIFRLIIFSFIIFFSISWLSQNSNDQTPLTDPTLFIGETVSPNVLGDMYNNLPEDSRNQFSQFISNSTEFIKSKFNGFPQTQIKEIKKAIIRNISDDMIKNIDEN